MGAFTRRRASKKLSPAVRSVVKRLDGGEARITSEAQRLGVTLTMLQNAVRLVGSEELTRLASVSKSDVQLDAYTAIRLSAGPTDCKRCGSESLPETDGNGLAVLICIRCGRREVVFPRLARAEERGP